MRLWRRAAVRRLATARPRPGASRAANGRTYCVRLLPEAPLGLLADELPELLLEEPLG
jgi:hypothetical protein